MIKTEPDRLPNPEHGTRCTDVLGGTLRGCSGIRELDFDISNGQLQVDSAPRSLSDERALGLAKRVRRVVWQNRFFSMAVIIFLVAIEFWAALPLSLGVVGHDGSTVLVVLNGLRLLRYQ